MVPPTDPDVTYRFGDFELDVAGYALRRDGRAVRLERRPMDLLIFLLERRGQLVPRADIALRLWGADLFVDVEMGVNTAVRKIRRALHDASDAPAYVETVQGKGYRFIAAVRAVRPDTEPAPNQVRLAVLPFENLTGDPAREYVADGLTEETIAVLGQIDPDHVAVIGRTSVMACRRTAKTLAEIGRELQASHLVESSVRAEGARLRVTVKLIRARDQVQIWSSSYDAEPSHMLAFQRELATAIAEQIRLRLSPERLLALARRQTRHPEAYDQYLRGRYLWNQLTPPTTREAIKHFGRATELDPDYALAWAGLSDAFVSSPINGDAPPPDVMPHARAAAEHAVRSEPDLCETQTSLGMVRFWSDWDWSAAETAYRRALALDPHYDLTHRMLGVLFAHMGRPAEAREALRRARELEPLNPMTHALSSHASFLARDYAGSLPFARQAIVIGPDFWIGHFMVAQGAEGLGEHELALEALGPAARLSGGNSKALSLRGYVLAKMGRATEAREALSTLKDVARARYVPPYAMALVHAGLGEHDAVFQWLDRAWDVRDVHLLHIAPDPKWDALRSDPRLVDFLRRCGLPTTPIPAG